MLDLTRPVRVTILGPGQMGLVCAGVLASPDPAAGSGERPFPKVAIWGHDTDEIGQLSQTRLSPRLPGYRLPESVRVLTADADIEPCDLVLLAIPVQFIRPALTRLADHLPKGVPIVSVAKGIETTTLKRPSEIIADVLGPRPVCALSGPTIASELARCLPATMIAAAEDMGLAEDVQKLFSTTWLRIYTNADLVGVEVAGATKNVIAIAAGILDGLNAGNNAKSALLARGLAEITRLGAALGAQRETFFGLAGVGDLATTCFSPEGRNRSCGEALGRGVSLESYLARSRSVVEGVATTQAVVALAGQLGVEMPITEAVYQVLFEGLDPLDAIGMLMRRAPTEERIG